MNSTTEIIPSVSLSSEIVFYTFILVDILSVICSFMLIYYFLRLQEYHRGDYSNQTVYYLLIGSFLVTSLDIPMILPYLQNHFYIYSFKYSTEFCMFWIILDYGMYSINLWLMALACFERYLQIFFKQFIMKTKIRRLVMYYLIVICIIVFVVSWYLYLIIFYPCTQTQFDFTQILCGFPCYKAVGSMTIQNLDWSLADLLPLFLSILFIFILIIHVFYQRYKMKKRLLTQETWKRTRKMFLQLFPIGFIFLFFNLPLIIVGLLAISNPWFNTTPYFYVNSLSYGLALCMPFAILSKQSPIQKRLTIFLRLRRFNNTAPATATATALRLQSIHKTNR